MEQINLFGDVYNKMDDHVISGYRIYNKEQERKTIRNDLPDFYPDLPEKNMILYIWTRLGTTAVNCNLIIVVKKR
jgi:hypothetical protein